MTFENICKRTQYLRGESDYSTAGTDLTIVKDHINYTVQDILNIWPFTWDLTTANLTLAAGVATMPLNYNPKWHIKDARIVASDDSDDTIFSEIRIEDRDEFTADEYRYWITYDTATETYIFNSKTLTGTVTIYYNFIPTDMSATTDVCVVPDGEAVAYIAAAKMWVGDERNEKLKDDYEAEGLKRIQTLKEADFNFTPVLRTGSPTDLEYELRED